MLIREFQPADALSFRELVLGALIVDFEFPGEVQQEDLANPQQYYVESGGKIYILDAGDHVIGSIAIARIDQNVARICRFYIDRDYRSIGLGKQLLEKALNYCRKAGYKQVYADVWYKMQPVIKLYEKMGFLFEKEEDGEIFMHLELR